MSSRIMKYFIQLIIFCIFSLTLTAAHFSPVHASDTIDKLSDIQNKIKSTIQQVKEARMKETSISSKIEDISKDINDRERELSQYNRQISKSRTEIRSLENEIGEMRHKMERRSRYLNERIRAIHKRQYGGDALVLMTASDYQDLIKKSKYMSLLAYYDGRVIKKYSSDIKEIMAKKRVIEDINEELAESKAVVEKKKNTLQADRDEKDKMLAAVKSRRLAQERKVNELKESSRKLQDMVKKLQNKSIPESIIGNGFTASKGTLPWPVKGEVIIPFGEYKDPELDATVFKNGIQIKVKEQDRPKAVAGGRVVYASHFDGYGNMLIIDHGSDYHSLYGNLSEMTLKQGELMIAGMEVGTAGRSADTGTPALYFEIRHKGRPVDPMTWLSK